MMILRINRSCFNGVSFLNLIGLLMAAIELCSAGAARSDDWPLFQHDARNTSYSAESIKPPFKLAWRVSTGNRYAILLAAGEKVCVTTSLGRYYVSSAVSTSSQATVKLYDASGRLIWTIPQAAALYLDRDVLVLVTVKQNTIHIDCYDIRTRQRKWSYPLIPTAYDLSVTVDHNTLLCSWYGPNDQGSFTLEQLQLSDGKLLRKSEQVGAQAVEGEHFYWGFGHWFHTVDVATLTPQWGFYDGGGDPVVAGPIVIGHGWGNWATAIDTRTRKKVWRYPVWRDSIHPLLHTSDGHTLILESTNVPVAVTAFAVDADRIVWVRRMFCSAAQAAGSGRYAFVPGWHEHLPGQQELRGGFYCLDADTGAERWKYEQPQLYGSAMIINGGCLYGLDAEGYLYRFVTVK